MATDINKFLSMFNKGGQASPSRYRVRFTLPRGIPRFQGAAEESVSSQIKGWQQQLNGNEKVNVLCHTCTMPQRSLMTYEHKQLNVPVKAPYSQGYDPVSFVFYGDGELHTRKFFEIWQNAVVNIQSNTMNFYSEYVSDITIEQLDKEGNPTYGVKLYEAYPMSITAIDYSYSNMNAIQNITVVMTYKYWRNLDDIRKDGTTV